jgi:N,N'-diacetylchitobiose phosphorylase
MTDFQYNLNIGQTRFKGNAIYHLTNHHAHQPCYAWFWSNRKVSSYDGVRHAFVGPYRSESNPVAVERGRCSNELAVGWAPFAGLHVDVELPPGAEEEVVFILGYGETLGDEARHLRKYRSGKAVDGELRALRSYWDETLCRYSTDTPDPAVNSMVNIWNQYQCRTTFNWSRSASYFESGIGRGMGFRDSNQDVLGFAHQIPGKARERLLDIAATQFPDGRASHQYSPLTKKGSGEGFGDDHLWLVIAVSHYVRESGDIAFLEMPVPYNDGSTGNMYDHLQKALDYSATNTGWHGLPKIENADWNDCLNLRGRGESMFSTFLFHRALREMVDLARRTGHDKDAEHFEDRRRELLANIEKYAWDGEWFLRGFLDDGRKLGGKDSDQAKIFINSQTWAVLSGAAGGDQARRCMDSLHRHLATEHGVVKNDPAYTEHDPMVGAITCFPPGLKENGGIFCHAACWSVVAEGMLGRGDLAMKLYRSFLPAAKNDAADVYTMEPYVYSQFITGKAHPYHFGRARNSWLTGTASWAFVAISQYILGVRADYDGLTVDPSIPAEWEGFEVTRAFRGATYNIKVTNPRHVCHGVRKLTAAGKAVAGTTLPVAAAGQTVEVELELG